MNYIFDFFLNSFCNLLDYVTGCDSYTFNREILKKNEELILIKDKLKQTKVRMDENYESLIYEINLTDEYYSKTKQDFENKKKAYSNKWEILSNELINLCNSVDNFTDQMNEKCERVIIKNQIVDIIADEIFSEKISSNIDNFRKFNRTSAIDELFEVNRYLSVSANGKGDINKILEQNRRLNHDYDGDRIKREIKSHFKNKIYVDKHEVNIHKFITRCNNI